MANDNISNEDTENQSTEEISAMEDEMIHQAEVSDFTFKHFSGIPQF